MIPLLRHELSIALALSIVGCGARTSLEGPGSGGRGGGSGLDPCAKDPAACQPRVADCARRAKNAVPLAKSQHGLFATDDAAVYFADGGKVLRVPFEPGDTTSLTDAPLGTLRGPIAVGHGTVVVLANQGLFAVPTQGGAPKMLGTDPNVAALAASPTVVDDRALLAVVGDQVVTGQSTLGGETGALYRTPLDGGDPVLLADGLTVQWLVADEAHGSVLVTTSTNGLLRIEVASGAAQVVDGTQGLSWPIAARGEDVYFSVFLHGLFRVRNGQPKVRVLDGGFRRVVADADAVYFDGLGFTSGVPCSGLRQGIIGRLPTDGGAAQELAVSDASFDGCVISSRPGDGMGVDGSFVYFAERCLEEPTFRIVRAPKHPSP